MKHYKHLKTILCVIEGCDKVGKTQLLQNLKTQYAPDDSVYIYEPPTSKKDRPDYKTDNKGYLKWPKDNYNNIIRDLEKLSNEYDMVIMRSLYIADLVYSNIFERKEISTPFLKKIRERYNIINHVIVFNTYNDYVAKCKRNNYDLEYDENEYNDIMNLYKEYAKKVFNEYGDLYRVSKVKYFTITKHLYKDFIEYMDSMYTILFKRSL